MKILFDQNISYRLIKSIKNRFPEAASIRELGLENATDIQIWDFAHKNGYSIVTFDADFYELSMLKKKPPKIIWLRTGNTSTENLIQLFLNKHDIISEFINNDDLKDIGCLEIG